MNGAAAALVPRTWSVASLAVLEGFELTHLTQHVSVRHFPVGEETHRAGSGVGRLALFGKLLRPFVDDVAIVGATIAGALVTAAQAIADA